MLKGESQKQINWIIKFQCYWCVVQCLRSF